MMLAFSLCIFKSYTIFTTTMIFCMPNGKLCQYLSRITYLVYIYVLLIVLPISLSFELFHLVLNAFLCIRHLVTLFHFLYAEILCFGFPLSTTIIRLPPKLSSYPEENYEASQIIWRILTGFNWMRNRWKVVILSQTNILAHFTDH